MSHTEARKAEKKEGKKETRITEKTKRYRFKDRRQMERRKDKSQKDSGKEIEEINVGMGKEITDECQKLIKQEVEKS